MCAAVRARPSMRKENSWLQAAVGKCVCVLFRSDLPLVESSRRPITKATSGACCLTRCHVVLCVVISFPFAPKYRLFVSTGSWWLPGPSLANALDHELPRVAERTRLSTTCIVAAAISATRWTRATEQQLIRSRICHYRMRGKEHIS